MGQTTITINAETKKKLERRKKNNETWEELFTRWMNQGDVLPVEELNQKIKTHDEKLEELESRLEKVENEVENSSTGLSTKENPL